ncbi:hypothetical protein ML8_1296 [Lactococcus lactis subsp. lactis]|nr:hypothetical protein ML8_1296 [Lactococcus lactis subsp. lactis]
MISSYNTVIFVLLYSFAYFLIIKYFKKMNDLSQKTSQIFFI